MVKKEELKEGILKAREIPFPSLSLALPDTVNIVQA